MEYTVLRVYNKNDDTSMIGKCYFLVMPDDYDDNYDLEPYLNSVCSMPWQTYTSYAIGTADIEDAEMYWSEIVDYTTYEAKIDIDRVRDLKRYKLPPWLSCAG